MADQEFGALKTAIVSVDNTTGALVAAVTRKRIAVLGWEFTCSAGSTLTLKSGTTAISGAMTYATNGGREKAKLPLSMASSEAYYYTALGAALNLTVSGGVCNGTLWYAEV